MCKPTKQHYQVEIMTKVRRYLATLVVVLLLPIASAYGQGISFSYLIPKNGYISAPVSPFSIRGVGFPIAPFTRIESGFSLYSMSGLAIDGLPFHSDKPLTGPHFTLMVPAELVLSAGIGRLGVSIMGGGFGHWHINPRINYGEMDRALRDWERWEVANAELNMDVKPGWGWLAGMGMEFQVNDQFSLTAEAHYLLGFANAPLNGSYTGGPDDNGNVITKPASFQSSRIVLEGIEVSLGVRLIPN